MSAQRLSEELLERVRRHRLLEADRADAAVSMMVGDFFQSPAGKPIAGALKVLRTALGQLGTPMPERQPTGDSGHPEYLLARPCSEAQVQASEKRLGFALPAGVRQLYLEVGNGDFGPWNGVFEVERIPDEYLDLTEEPAGPQGETWPESLLPIADLEPGFTCIDVGSGRIVDWDPQASARNGAQPTWEDGFTDVAPNLERWLEDWVKQIR